MGNSNLLKSRKKPALVALEGPAVRDARNTIQARRAAAGSNDVTQADVDLAADVLVHAGARPFPQLIAQIAGGSLSTITPMFEDWWSRFVALRLDPHTPGLELPVRVALQVRHLMAGVESAIRGQLRGLTTPQEVLSAAAALGERQALKEEIAALQNTRKKLEDALAAMTYRVSELDTRLNAQAEARDAGTQALGIAVKQLLEAVQATQAKLDTDALQQSQEAIQLLSGEVRRMRTLLTARPHRIRAHARKRKSPARTRAKTSRSHKSPNRRNR